MYRSRYALDVINAEVRHNVVGVGTRERRAYSSRKRAARRRSGSFGRRRGSREAQAERSLELGRPGELLLMERAFTLDVHRLVTIHAPVGHGAAEHFDCRTPRDEPPTAEPLAVPSPARSTAPPPWWAAARSGSRRISVERRSTHCPRTLEALCTDRMRQELFSCIVRDMFSRRAATPQSSSTSAPE